MVLSSVVNAHGPSGQDELPDTNPAAERVPMGIRHCQKANSDIVEQEAVGIANGFCADPKRVGLAREGELHLELITATIAKNRQRVEDQAVLSDAGHKCGQHLIVRYQLCVQRHRNQGFAVGAQKHRPRSYG